MRQDPLTGSELLEYSERGFLRPGRVFDEDQLQTLRDLVASLAVREQNEGRLYDLLDPALWPTTDEVDGHPPEKPGRVDFVFNLWRIEPRIREFIFDSRLSGWASQLIGSSSVRLLEDNALWKEPHTGGELKWHQDYPYWPLAQPNAITAWIALDDTDADNGAMSVAVSSHLTGECLPAAFGTGTPYRQDRRPSVVKPIEDPESLGFDIEILSLEAGEVSFHSSLLWHASGPNNSDRQRRAIIIRYVGDGTIWLGSARYEYNYTDEEVELAVGDPIGGEYFPLIPA